jgi:hypothetical protein
MAFAVHIDINIDTVRLAAAPRRCTRRDLPGPNEITIKFFR